MDQRFALTNVIQQLRAELQLAEDAATKEGLKFGVDGIELELKVSLKETDDSNMGLKFYVFNLGKGGKSESEQALTLKLKLKPEGEHGALKVAKQTPERPGTP